MWWPLISRKADVPPADDQEFNVYYIRDFVMILDLDGNKYIFSELAHF